MKPSLKFVLVIAGALLFNLIFWQEKFALNAVLFDVFALVSLVFLYPGGFKSRPARWLLFAHLVTAVSVLLHNTVLSKVAFSTSLLLVAVFTQYNHRSAWYAAASMLMNYACSPISILTDISRFKTRKFRLQPVARQVRFIWIPVMLLGIFLLMYGTANKAFLSITHELGVVIDQYFRNLFEWVSWSRAGFFAFGLFITTGLLWKSGVTYFSDLDNRRKNELTRIKRALAVWEQTSWFDLLSIIMGRFATGMLALRNEHTTGLISLLLLNLLLLFINCIDIIYVWFGFEDRSKLNLSEYVHEGTGILIISILLAIVLLLFFFRGNLNFYRKNKWLRYGAYAWIFQNAVLAVSVIFRDYYYIQRLGLAYKRIGVLFFLALVLCGLITVFIKIHQRKTNYFLLRINAWCVVAMLVGGSCVHWDEEIARYNLARKHLIGVDVNFLLTLSDKTLPLLEKNKDIFEQSQLKGEKFVLPSGSSALERFESRKKKFKIDQAHLSWLSWNQADAVTKQQLGQAGTVDKLITSGPVTSSVSSSQTSTHELGDTRQIFSLRSCVVLPVWPNGFMEGY